MTVNANDAIEKYVISGAGPYAFSFRIFSASDLTVCAVNASGVATPLVLNTHYFVPLTSVNRMSGGHLTLSTGPTGATTVYAGQTLDIRSNVPNSQPINVRNTRLLAEALEDGYDNLARQIQDLRRIVSLSLRLPDYDVTFASALPNSSARANSYLITDASGNFGLSLIPPAGNEGSIPAAADTGTVNGIVCSRSGYALTSLAMIWVRVLNTTTSTTPTLNVQGTGAKTIVNPDGSALLVGALVAGGTYCFTYDGTNYQLISATQKSVDAATTTANSALALANTSMQQGLTTIPVLAAAMQAATTNGAAPGIVETTTNRVLYRTLDFDQTTQEFAGFTIPMPKNWNEGTVTFQPLWTFATSAGGVVWALQAVAVSDDDTLDVAFGTEQTSTDVSITAGDLHVGPTSAAITIAGTPAVNDLVAFRVKRVPADANDNLLADARLIGIRLFFTTNASNDA